MSTKKRLSELGIAQPEDELKILQVENSRLKKELENKKNELQIVKSNFQETLQKIIESARAVNYDIVFYPPQLDQGSGYITTGDGTGNAPSGIQGGDSGDASVYGDNSSDVVIENNRIWMNTSFTTNNSNFSCGDVSFRDREF